MTKEELLIELEALRVNEDPEADHSAADKLLLEYINDNEITAAFETILKWYA